MRGKKIYAILLGMLMMLSIFGVVNVYADSYADATITWIVAGDETISVSYPAETTEVKFDCSSGTFEDQPAKSQTGATSPLQVQNDGNTNLQINATWTADFITGVTMVNISVGDNTNSTLIWWTDSNETTANHTLVASLPPTGSDTEDFWMWSTGTDVAETAGTSKTLRLWSQTV